MDYNINTCVTNLDQKESQETFVLRSSDIKFFKKRNKTVCEMVFLIYLWPYVDYVVSLRKINTEFMRLKSP